MGPKGFSDLALKAEHRTEFILDALNWISKYGLDGIDLDWEYPVGPPEGGLPIVTRPEDAENYVLLLQEMRIALDAFAKILNRPLTLTVAVPASLWFLEVIDVLAVQEEVDYFKLMSYDYYGGWSKTTGHAANLYNNPDDPEQGGWSTDQAVTAFINAGVKPGENFNGGALLCPGVAWCTEPKQWPIPRIRRSGIPRWFNLHGHSSEDLDRSSFKRYWDDVAKAPFLYNGDLWITYEDAESLAYKVEYIKEKGLAGIMIWEYAHDINAELLEALNRSIEEG